MRIAAYRTMQGSLTLAAVVMIVALAVFMADQLGLYGADDLLLAPPAPSQDPLGSHVYVQGDVTTVPGFIARWLLAFAGVSASRTSRAT